VTIGLDGGGLDDLYGMCVLGRERETGNWLAWHHAWAHEKVLELRKEIAPRLKDFADDGDLTIVSHVGKDIDEIASRVQQVAQTGLLDRDTESPHRSAWTSEASAARSTRFQPTTSTRRRRW
jgi:phage terminase large subunit-like protein